MMSQYLLAMFTRHGDGGAVQFAGGLFMFTAYSLLFSLGYTPLWVVLGLVAAWRVPVLATRNSWRRACLEGAALGAMFQVIFAGVITWGFYSRSEYRGTGDLARRFIENTVTFAAPLALIAFAAWVGIWCRRMARRRKHNEVPCS
jgi:hypothetical protein